MTNETDVAVTGSCAQPAPKGAVVADRLEKLGFKTAGAKVKELVTRKAKMALAYELYRFVRPENITAFNKKLHDKTYKGANYQMLDFMGIESYEGAPPENVLASLEQAQGCKVGGAKVFDKFEVAYIRNVADPIIFGRINGCPDRFYIDQWDDDVKISDLLASNEG